MIKYQRKIKNIYLKKDGSDKKYQITWLRQVIINFNNAKVLVLYDGQTLNN